MSCKDQHNCTDCNRNYDNLLGQCPICSGTETTECSGCPTCGGRGYLGIIPDDVKIIGIVGRAGSGKDFIADNFFLPMGYHPVAFASNFKWKVVGSGFTYEEVFDTKPPDVRRLLQQEGTERGRDAYGRQLWIRTVEAHIHFLRERCNMKKFIMTDVRFKNEMQWVRSLGGKLAFIDSDRAYQMNAEAMAHPSETEMMTVPKDSWDYVFNNNLDVDKGRLHRQVEQFVERFSLF